jgi:hypothetical protein
VIKAVSLAAVLLAAPVARAAAPTAACPPAVEEEPDAGALPHLGAALKPGATINILAVGAGGDVKPVAAGGAPAPAGFFNQLTHGLESAVHGLHASVTVRGGRGLMAPQQLDLIRGSLQLHGYQLVLWQTGTIDAVEDEPPEHFYQTLQDGADAVAAAGADLVLVEPQYSRFLEANADLSPYLSALQEVASAPGTLVFHRYALMHDWEDAGLIDLEHAALADRPAVAARLHACLAAELARYLITGAALAR